MGAQRAELEVGMFEEFVAGAEARLRIALIATYGPLDGQTAALDALSWAWENWDRVQVMANPVGYLYRVGQTAARRQRVRPIPIDSATFRNSGIPDINPELVPALGRLSAQQRTVVMLVHGFGWTIRDVARMLELAPSTVQTHLERGLARLRDQLEERHDD
jgi:DNA-directed RNA polymerase specialized sigma24 family protein